MRLHHFQILRQTRAQSDKWTLFKPEALIWEQMQQVQQTDTSDNIGLNLRKMKQWVRAFRVSFFPIHKVHPRGRNNVAHNPKHTNSTQNKTMGQDWNQNHSLNSRYMKASIYTTTATTAKMHMFFLKYTAWKVGCYY